MKKDRGYATPIEDELSDEWTKEYFLQAQYEGWYLHLGKEWRGRDGDRARGVIEPRLAKYIPHPSPFKTPEQAVAFVKKKAEEGSTLHQVALTLAVRNRLL